MAPAGAIKNHTKYTRKAKNHIYIRCAHEKTLIWRPSFTRESKCAAVAQVDGSRGGGTLSGKRAWRKEKSHLNICIQSAHAKTRT